MRAPLVRLKHEILTVHATKFRAAYVLDVLWMEIPGTGVWLVIDTTEHEDN